MFLTKNIYNLAIVTKLHSKLSLIQRQSADHIPLLIKSCIQLFCNPMNCSPPSSSVHGIIQAGILEWVAIPFSRGSYQPRDQTRVSAIAGRFLTI